MGPPIHPRPFRLFPQGLALAPPFHVRCSAADATASQLREQIRISQSRRIPGGKSVKLRHPPTRSMLKAGLNNASFYQQDGSESRNVPNRDVENSTGRGFSSDRTAIGRAVSQTGTRRVGHCPVLGRSAANISLPGAGRGKIRRRRQIIHLGTRRVSPTGGGRTKFHSGSMEGQSPPTASTIAKAELAWDATARVAVGRWRLGLFVRRR